MEVILILLLVHYCVILRLVLLVLLLLFIGSSLLHYYGFSPSKLLMEVFPSFNWDKDKFRRNSPDRASKNYWKDKGNQLLLLERIGTKVGVKNTEDWYQISSKKIVKNGGQL